MTAQLDVHARSAPRAAPAPGRGSAGSRIPGLDGLRAVAVIAVVVYHLAPAALPGGYLGVDVFFVVSGFLITTLLLRELDTRGRLSLPAFWTRRARRLLPALGVVVVASVLVARLVDGDLLVGIGRQVLGAATFTTNWWEIAAGVSYFDERQPELLQPLWSLAIEEQFYLLWPALLVVGVVALRSWRRLAAVVLGGGAASAVAMAVLVTLDEPTRVYYGTDTHAFGLLLGAAAAFSLQDRGRLLRSAAARWVGPAALVGLGVLAATMHDDGAFAYRGGLALASLLALLAVASCTTGGSGYLTVLEHPGLRWVGERSYGLYLWHWPVALVVHALLRPAPGSGRWWLSLVVSLAVTVAVSAASYRWVETPVRRDGFRATWRRVAAARGTTRGRVVASAVAAVLLAFVLAVATAPRASQAQLAVERGAAAVASSTESSTESSTGSSAESGTDAAQPEPTGSPTPAHAVTGEDVIGFGDSVMSAAAPALLKRFPGIELDAEPIRKWVDAPDVVRAAADDGRLRPVVVLAFGTNGGFQFTGSEDAMREVLDLIGPDRQVVLVNSSGVSHWVPGANAHLAEVAADYPGTVVVDWYSTAVADPHLLHSDDTHPTMAGIEVYADLLEDAFAGLEVPAGTT